MKKIVMNCTTGKFEEIELSEEDIAGLHIPTEQELKDEHNAPILAQISEIETQQARPLRESYSADDVVREQAIIYIKKYDDQITELRSQLI